MSKVIMKTDDKISNGKLKEDINTEAAKISALSSGKFDKSEYVTSEEILPPDESRMIEQAKFSYSPLEKLYKKKNKNESQGEKQIKAI